MKPKISVIVPVLNREKLIVRCLDSIRRQREQPYELIVVDNGSTDHTVAVVTNWMLESKESGIKMSILEERQKGACFARQKGLDEAKGDYVLFFDSDDEMHDDLLEEAVGMIDVQNAPDIVCWKCRIIQLNDIKRVPPFNPQKPLENHLIHTLLRPQGYLVGRDFIKSSGGWQKNIAVWNDFELGLRLLHQHPKIASVNKVLATIYSQEDSITGRNFSHKQGEWEKTIGEMRKENNSVSSPETFKVEKILTYREIILAAHYAKEGNPEGAKKLKAEAMKRASGLSKALLSFTYHYTRKGGRGAWRIIRPFYI